MPWTEIVAGLLAAGFGIWAMLTQRKLGAITEERDHAQGNAAELKYEVGALAGTPLDHRGSVLALRWLRAQESDR